MKHLVNKLFPASFKDFVKRKAGVPDIFTSMERLKQLDFKPLQVVDVGAYEGEWTKKCAQIFPESRILMVEAMPSKKEKLERLIAGNKNIDVAIEVLGARSGDEVFFSEIETASSVLEEVSASHSRIQRTTTALQDVLKKRDIKKVDFLKLDVQGYELEVLKGYTNFIANTDVILSEVSLLDIHKNVPLLKDVIDFMYRYGFVVYDICSVATRRPLDQALWQTDLMFVKEDSKFRKDKNYQK